MAKGQEGQRQTLWDRFVELQKNQPSFKAQVKAMVREGVKDIRSTLMRTFFNAHETPHELGTPLAPTQSAVSKDLGNVYNRQDTKAAIVVEAPVVQTVHGKAQEPPVVETGKEPPVTETGVAKESPAAEAGGVHGPDQKVAPTQENAMEPQEPTTQEAPVQDKSAEYQALVAEAASRAEPQQEQDKGAER